MLPPSRYVGVQEETRKVTADCLISFNGSRYSVPWLDKLHAQKRINARYHLAQLLEVAKLNVFTVHFIVGVLERHQARIAAVSRTPSAHQIPVADVHRNLDAYRLAE